jgi:Secretion system C-terminal sorting domain
VDTWRTSWSAPSTTLTDLQIAGNDTKKYDKLDFAGVEFVGPNLVNASSMLYFHLDLWTPNITTFRVKLVDFGADKAFGGADDKEHELALTPTLNGWNQFEIPLTDFVGLTTKSNVAQMIISGIPVATGTAYIDNVYFHKVPFVDPNTPMVAAPTPTRPAADVISLFSNAYTNKPVDTWRTGWSAATTTLTDLQIAGNDTKKYSGLDFVGIETIGNQVNASGMDAIHLDVWTPNLTIFRIKLVDLGANAAIGGGDDKEHEVVLTPLNQKAWNSYEIPLANFTGLTTRAHIGQIILSGAPVGTGTVFIDNLYFRKASVGTNNFDLSGIKMYPNPTSDFLTIEAKSNIEQVIVYDVLGQEVLVSTPNVAKTNLDIAKLNQGFYTVKMKVDGLISTSTIVKK